MDKARVQSVGGGCGDGSVVIVGAMNVGFDECFALALVVDGMMRRKAKAMLLVIVETWRLSECARPSS